MQPRMPPMPYPAALEKFWIQRAVQATGGPEAEDTALRRLESKVQALSDLFTAGRPAKDFPDYFADRSLLAAYGVFFFPQSFAKAQWALDFAMRLRGWVPHSENIRILDLGAGAGPCGLALAFALRARFPACATSPASVRKTSGRWMRSSSCSRISALAAAN